MFFYSSFINLEQPGFYLKVFNDWAFPEYIADILHIETETLIEMLKKFNAKEYKYNIYYFEKEEDVKAALESICVLAKLADIDYKKLYLYSYNLNCYKIIPNWYITYQGIGLNPKYMCIELKMPLEDYKKIMLECNANWRDGATKNVTSANIDPDCCFEKEIDGKLALNKLRQYLKNRGN